MRELTHTVAPEDDGRFIKDVLRKRMGLSTRQMNRLKRQGGMLLGGAPVHANARVRAGEVVAARLEEEGDQALLPEPGPLDIVYEDDDLLILDKPAPLPCQATPGQPGGALANRLAARYGAPYVFRPVNRLDKGTSGLMAVAKHAHAHNLLRQALHTPDFVRAYEAVCVGAPQPPAGWIDLPIAKAPGATVRRQVDPEGKSARTWYETLAVHGGYAHLRLVLDTGRTHQIRVHLSHLGCPIAGDFLYGQEDPRLPGRFALHASAIALRQPITGRALRFASPLPAPLRLWER